ncbi:MAG TPA: 4-hydroxy-tetrahydrodipicolinate reductase [Syntrophorhabdaceae bacterium]|nr:4-hydroxy-tetrahydrodipicolinate reductase [Syntrophorhabdaceae bacterium]
MIRLIITGAAGKMGKTIKGLSMADKDFEIKGLIEKKGHSAVGSKDLDTGIEIIDDIEGIVEEGDVIIDFTEPKATLGHLKIAKKYKKAMVIGTTGFSHDELNLIKGTDDTRIVFSPNMSIGMNLMFDLVERAAKILRDGYDIEIFEMHHKWKKDAPSGTAIRLKEIIEQVDKEKNWIEIYGREGITGERRKEEIGILASRAGDIVGEHTVYFAGIGERIEITHRASSRENFAKGALIAAKWVVKQKNGFYTMKDVLGL